MMQTVKSHLKRMRVGTAVPMQPPTDRALALRLVTDCDFAAAEGHRPTAWAQPAAGYVLGGFAAGGIGARAGWIAGDSAGGCRPWPSWRASCAASRPSSGGARRRATAQQPVLASEYQLVTAETAEACDQQPDPERWLIAAQQLQAIGTLFAHDPVALQIIAGLGDGLTAEEIRQALGMTKTDL